MTPEALGSGLSLYSLPGVTSRHWQEQHCTHTLLPSSHLCTVNLLCFGFILNVHANVDTNTVLIIVIVCSLAVAWSRRPRLMFTVTVDNVDLG